MSFIPEDKLQSQVSFNLTPMIDFLFLMLVFFATIAISRASLFDQELHLAKIKNEKGLLPSNTEEKNFQVHLGISKEGAYNWLTEEREYPLSTIEKVQKELAYQQEEGILPSDKTKTEVLLHIDREAPWEAIAKMLFAIRKMGFETHPVYEQENLKTHP